MRSTRVAKTDSADLALGKPYLGAVLNIPRFATPSERRNAPPPHVDEAMAMFNLLIKFLHGNRVPVSFTNTTGYSLMGAQRTDDDMEVTVIEPQERLTIELPIHTVFYTYDRLGQLVSDVNKRRADDSLDGARHEHYGWRYLFVPVTLSIAFTDGVDDTVSYRPYQYIIRLEQQDLHRLRLRRTIDIVQAEIIQSQQRTLIDVLRSFDALDDLRHVPKNTIEYEAAINNTLPLGKRLEKTPTNTRTRRH